MPDSNNPQSLVQPAIQPLAPLANNGNPMTGYNMAPQGDAFGNWSGVGAPSSSSIISRLLNNSYGRYPNVPTTASPTTPATSGGPIVTAPVVTPAPVDPALLPRFGGGRVRARNGGGGGGGECVAATMFLAPHIRANTVGKGFISQCYSPEEGFKSHPIEQVSAPVQQPCWRLVTQFGAALVCSESTPFDLPDGGSCLAPAMLGQIVFVKRGSYVMKEKVVSCEYEGEHAVVPIGYGGRSFPAGENPEALVYSHNIVKAHDASADIGRMRAILDGFGFSRESGFMEGNAAYGLNPYASPDSFGGGGNGQPVTVDQSTGQPLPPTSDSDGWTTRTDEQGRTFLVPPPNTPVNKLPPLNAPPPPNATGPGFWQRVGGIGNAVWRSLPTPVPFVNAGTLVDFFRNAFGGNRP